jgi:hypothetical protein
LDLRGSGRRLHSEELPNLYTSPDAQIKEDEMGGSCSMYGEDEKCVQNLKGRNHSEDPGINVRLILECILKSVGVRTVFIWCI